MNRILVTGSRHLVEFAPSPDRVEDHWHLVARGLERHGPGLVVHGDAQGCDRMAAAYAVRAGWPTPEPHPADWSRGKVGGRERNQLMVDLGADVCLAFPRRGSIGTFDCLVRARRAGIPCRIVLSDMTEAEAMECAVRAERRL